MSQDNSISLNKYISSKGICSRREADRWIEEGRLKINGQLAKKGNRVSPRDEVLLDGKALPKAPKKLYIAFHKPAGVTCTTDRRDRSNIVDFIGHKERIFPIGRLDKPSTGLILLTNDGDMVNPILRVENGHEKEYIVTVDKSINSRFLQRMAGGLPILGQITKKAQVEQLGPKRFRIILKQGLNRQIRRMCEYLGYEVRTLKRVRIMNIELEQLPKGQWRELSAQELKNLEKQL